MSRASLYVRFPDGTIRYGMYCGTSDVVWPALFDTLDEAWGVYRHTKSSIDAWYEAFHPEPHGDSMPVDMYEDYGAGRHFAGRATMNAVISPLTWEEFEETAVKGRPEWMAS